MKNFSPDAAKANSAFNRMNFVEGTTLDRISQREGSLMERVEKITPLVEEQLKTYNETHELVRKATELLEKYREPALVPIEEITSSDIDDARLIAAINYLHKRKNELN